MSAKLLKTRREMEISLTQFIKGNQGTESTHRS